MHPCKNNRNLRISFWDGVFASGMFGFTQEYFTPFLLFLGGAARHVGILSAFPNMLASLLQLKSADLVEALKSRRKVMTSFVFLQALTLMLIAAMPLVGAKDIVLFIAFATLYTVCGALVAPAWGSLMSDLVPQEVRGEYFGWRYKTLGLITVGAAFAAGFILYRIRIIAFGFAVIFGLAALFRLISWSFLRRMQEPELGQNKDDYFTLVDFLSRIKESSFVKFALFVSLNNFSVYLAAPFFSVYMIRDLHFNYLLYTILTVAQTLTMYVTVKRWGMHADRIGNIKVMRFTAPLIAFVPLLWIINQHPVFLFIAQIFSGFVWAGFSLSTTNFIYDACRPTKRPRCIAFFNLFNGISISIGAILGGFLVQHLPPLFGNTILSLMLLSAVCRGVVAFTMFPKLTEVRPVQAITGEKLFFSLIGIRPILKKS